MDHVITHGQEGTRIVFTFTPEEAKDVHADMRPKLDTSLAFDKFDAELNDALRAVHGRSYRKATQQ